VSRSFPGDPFAPVRRPTRVVRVGDVAIGGDHPIRIQSMTTTDTQGRGRHRRADRRLAAAGCEIVRITAPSVRDAEALGEIKASCCGAACACRSSPTSTSRRTPR
jgi:(E)-4-hydroxy-3-methylbut-2-enyl-diphosphate synthase